jgi:exosortase A
VSPPLASAQGNGWRLALPLATLLALCLVFSRTIGSMVSVWSQSETFAHGVLIGPICLVLVWRQRAELARSRPSACYPALLGMLLLGLAWLAADVANVPVLAQYAVVAMLSLSLLAVLGVDSTRHIAFPLIYLLLAVPSGEFLIAPLIDFTATFTVAALQAVGVPVFRDGNMLSVPTGNWAVVDACSGLRYSIACFALGVLYAHFMYQSWLKRCAFVALSIALPILANGMRAFMIVMIGHWSDMKLATGIDHIVYGSVFFALVLVFLFWLGRFWREDPTPLAAAGPVPAQANNNGQIGLALACVGIAAMWPLISIAIEAGATPTASLAIAHPPDMLATASPQLVQFTGSDSGLSTTYDFDAQQVRLQLALYRQHGEGVRRASSQCADYGVRWRRQSHGAKQVALGAISLSVQQSILINQDGRLLVWCWFRQSGIDTSSAAYAKALLAGHALLGLREDGARIVLATRIDDQLAPAVEVLKRFLSSMHQPISQGVDHASSR